MSLFEGVESIDSVRDLSNLEGIIYTFMTEDGRRDIEYKEYLDDMEVSVSEALERADLLDAFGNAHDDGVESPGRAYQQGYSHP